MPPGPEDGTATGSSHEWSTGRYPSLAPNLLPATARLVNAAGVDAGDRVLDVGCGTGNVAITAARSGASVVGLDVTPRMIELARESARLAGVTDDRSARSARSAPASSDDEAMAESNHAVPGPTLTGTGSVTWVEGDAGRLPFQADTFEVVCSNFGHVFAPEPDRVGGELRRVTRPGGRIAFTAWTPDGLVGELTRVLERHVTRPASDPWAHLEWGRPAFVREQFPAAPLDVQRRIARFRYVSPAHFWREFAEEAGPLSPVLGRLEDPEARSRLRSEALATLEEWFADNEIRVEYLLVRAVVE